MSLSCSKKSDKLQRTIFPGTSCPRTDRILFVIRLNRYMNFLSLNVFAILLLILATKLVGEEPNRLAANWTNTSDLPILRADPIKPKDATKFKHDGVMGYWFPSIEMGAKMIREKTIGDEKHTIEAAKAWITDQFGEFPDGVSLRTEKVHTKTAYENGRPSDVGFERTIAFVSCYRGLPTAHRSVVTITDGSNINGYVNLRSYTPVGQAFPIKSSSDAKLAWRKVFLAQGESKETLNLLDNHTTPRLIFVYAPRANSEVGLEYEVVSPTWVLDEAERYMVDARSGKPWLDD